MTGRLFAAMLVAMLSIGAPPVLAGESPSFTDTTEIMYLVPFKAYIAETIKFPFLAGENPLVRGNNIALRLGADATPVSVNAEARLIWTPCAVVSGFAGIAAGTGWIIPIGKGLAENARSSDGFPTVIDRSLQGAVWTAEFGGNGQFDLGAVIPGTWTHVFFQTTQMARYRAFTGTTGGEAWYWVDDRGENRNGWRYWSNYVLGYRLPFMVEAAGVYAECERYLSGGSDGAAWGEDYSHWSFGPALNVRFTGRLSLTAMCLFHNARNFKEGTAILYYRDRVLDLENPERIEFYMVYAKFTYRLR